MKTFATKEKRSAPAVRKIRPYVHHPMGPVQLAQRAEIRRILRSTGAQAKLTIGPSNDKYEHEADRIADEVMRMPDPTLQRQVEEEEEELQAKSVDEHVQRQPMEEEEEELQAKCADERIQRQPMEEEEEELQAKFADERIQRQPEEEEEEETQAKSNPGETPKVPSGLEPRINSLKDGGQPLDPATRNFFESRIGHDFSHVRVHHGGQATEIARAVNARAFTLGDSVMFGEGEYVPESAAGKRLLAHELTHVVQQNGGRHIRQRGATPLLDDPHTLGRKRLLAHELTHVIQQQGVKPKQQASSHPCKGTSLAATYVPSDKNLTVSLGKTAFGNTSKLAAYFGFGACKVKNDWRFFLKSLSVKVGSKVQPVNFRNNIDNANNNNVTRSTYKAIVKDLAPNNRVRFRVSCAGNRFLDAVASYSWRKNYWNRQFVVDHEAFHRNDWDKYYRKELVQAEEQIWSYRIPVSAASSAKNAVSSAKRVLTSYMIDAYQRTCKAYTPKKESRAYDNGKSQYQKLVDAILARAKSAKW